MNFSEGGIIVARDVMRTTIELPDPVYRRVEQCAHAQGITIEEFILRTFERELKIEMNTQPSTTKVSLPLVPSKRPGTLDLKDFNFDDLLA